MPRTGKVKDEDKQKSAVHVWTPRPHQRDSLVAASEGYKRQILIWHRRAGKDEYALNLAQREALSEVGEYWHLFPKSVQARRAIWNGIREDGQPVLQTAFPDALVDYRSGPQDMYIRLHNGSIWYLIGSDNYDRLVGANVKGVVFSEWALCRPEAWDYIRPMIRRNNGWAVFITTYRGRNHAWKMVEELRDNPEWYVDIRDVTKTTDNDGNRLITDEMIEQERRDGMAESLIQQEYYCNPIAGNPGAYYGRQVAQLMDQQQRVH